MNEIYRDLASIVDQQQESVDMIESNTEGAHARAQEGLAQVRTATLFLPFDQAPLPPPYVRSALIL